MSASDQPDPQTLIGMAEGQNLPTIIRNGVGGFLLAVSSSAILGLQAVLEVMVLAPAELLAGLMRASVEGFLIGPINVILPEGAEITAATLDQFGILAWLVALVIVLIGFYIIIKYIRERETTDVPIPGLAVDVIPGVGVEEEANEED